MKDIIYDVIVVGSGLGGLTAAATLSKKGKKVLVVEQHYVPGGCATAFKRKDFVVEVGLHEMDGMYGKDMKNEVFDLLEIRKSIELIKIPEFYKYKGQNHEFIHPHGDENTIKQLVATYPEDEKGIRKYFQLMASVMAELPNFPTDVWKQRLMFPLMPMLFPNIVKASKISLGDWLDKNMTNDELKLNLTANLVYYHDDPYSMSLIYWSIAQTSYINGGGHFIKGGSQKLSNHLVNVIEQGSGQVLLGKKVIGIHIERGKASGVCYVDAYNLHGSCISVKSKLVIANAPLPMVKELLPPKESLLLEKQISKMDPACALLSIYIGLNKELSSLGNKHYSTFFSGNKVHSLMDIRNNNQGAWNDKGFIFVDYSQIDAELSPKGKGLAVICAADYLTNWEELSGSAYKLKKDEVAQLFLERIEKEFPGINEHIDYCEVATAKTIKRYTSSPAGTAYGFAQTPKQAGLGRVAIKSPIANLFFAGAWTFPGGGFTGAILSGYLCAQKTLKRLGKVDLPINPQKLYNNEVEVKEVKRIANNTIEICLSKPAGFQFMPGQYAVLEILNPKFEALDIPIRPLSMVSHPTEPNLRFAMRVSKSSYKQSLSLLKPKNKCRVFGPMGKFTLKNKNKDIAFIVAGIGITPVMPMLEDLKEQGFKGNVHLIYSNKTVQDAAYHSQLMNYKGLNLNYIPVFTSNASRINGSFLMERLKNVKNMEFYLVGTDLFVETIKDILKENNVDETAVFMDSFG